MKIDADEGESMTEKIRIDEDELNNGIYEAYKLYRDYYHQLTHSENLLVIDFGEFLMRNLFNNLKKGGLKL